MRDLIFKFGSELIAIKVNNKQLQFCKVQGGYVKYSPIEGLKLEVSGILKEFPDLKGKEEKQMKKIAIQRFKKKIASMKTEEEIQKYLKDDLKKHGYIMTHIRRAGFRKKRVK